MLLSGTLWLHLVLLHMQSRLIEKSNLMNNIPKQ